MASAELKPGLKFGSGGGRSAVLAAWLVRHRKKCLIPVVLFAVGFSSLMFRISFESSVESFYPQSDPALVTYRAFKAEFGDDQLIGVAIPVGDVFTKETLEHIDELSLSIEKLPLVRKVHSITETQDITGSAEGFEVGSFIEKIPEAPEKLAALRASALANPLYQVDLVSLDGKIACLLIEAKKDTDPDRYKTIITQVRTLLQDSPLGRRPHYFAGSPLVELEMTEGMWQDLFTFMPLTTVLLILIFVAYYRSLRVSFLLTFAISLCLGVTAGLIGVLGRMNAVTVGLPSLMLSVATLDCVHIFNLYRIQWGEVRDRDEALRRALRMSLVPCLLTSLTTAAGFFSICTSALVPIRQFGFLAACSALAAYPISFLTMPCLLSWLAPASIRAPGGDQPWLGHGLDRIRGAMPQGPVAAGLLLVLLVGLSAAGMSRIEVETNHLKFLKDGSEVKKGNAFTEKHLAGLGPLEVLVKAPKEGGIKDPKVLRQMERFQADIVALPTVDKSVSLVQFVKEMHQAFNAEDPAYYALPDTRNLVAQYILMYSFSGRDNDLDDFVDYHYQTGRIRVRLSSRSSKEVAADLEQIRALAATHFSPELKVDITSHTVIQSNMVATLVRGQVYGLALSFLIIFLTISAIHRSWIIGLFSLIPNLIPLLTAAGLMGWMGISLNAGTAMTACIALGLVVDDTIHFLHHIRRELVTNRPTLAVQRVLRMVSPAVTVTSLVLAVGFGVMLFGHSLIIMQFGFLCVVMIGGAWICDLLLLPILIERFERFQNALRLPVNTTVEAPEGPEPQPGRKRKRIRKGDPKLISKDAARCRSKSVLDVS